MSKVMIVYAPGTKTPRRYIIPDHDWELNDPRHVQPGEAFIIVDHPNPIDNLHHDRVKQYIADHHGIDVATIPVSLCDIINNATGEIVGQTSADPDIDKIEGHTLVPLGI
jgi:hypothetical protein